MFYSGGALKKKTVFRILHHTKQTKSGVNESGPNETGIEQRGERSRSRSRSRSKSRSRSRSRSKSQPRSKSKTISTRKRTEERTDDTESESESDSGSETDRSEQPPEVNDYVSTVSSDSDPISRYYYSFVDNELDYSLEQIEDGYQKESTIDQYNKKEIRDFSLIIYRINTSQDIPFLEFLLYHEKGEKSCGLPVYHHKKHYSTGKTHIKSGIDDIVNRLFSTKFRYKGYIYDEPTHRAFVFYEKYFDVNQRPFLVSLQEPFNWLWVCSTEILNDHKYMNIPIDDITVDFFTAYPMVGLLQQPTSITTYSDSSPKNIEAPIVLYTGANYCYTANTALYGLKREAITSRYGPFYYFTSFDYSFRWACYNYKNVVSFDPTLEKANPISKEGEKYTGGGSGGRGGRGGSGGRGGGGISRYAVFTKRTKVVFLDDEYNPEIVKKYKLKKSLFEHNGSDSGATKPITTTAGYSEYLDKTSSLHSYDYSWTRDYDTIYNGYYEFDEKHQQTNTNKTIMPVWCIYNHRHFEALTYSQVDTNDIPAKYDYQFKNYRIL